MVVGRCRTGLGGIERWIPCGRPGVARASDRPRNRKSGAVVVVGDGSGSGGDGQGGKWWWWLMVSGGGGVTVPLALFASVGGGGSDCGRSGGGDSGGGGGGGGGKIARRKYIVRSTKYLGEPVGLAKTGLADALAAGRVKVEGGVGWVKGRSEGVRSLFEGGVGGGGGWQRWRDRNNSHAGDGASHVLEQDLWEDQW